MAEHLDYRGVDIEARSKAGQFTSDVLLLNDGESRNYRRWVIRSVERCLWSAESILKTLAELDRRILVETGPALDEMLHDRRILEERFVQVQEDLERLTCQRLTRGA